METANRSRRWTRLAALAGAAVLSASVGASVAGGAAGAPVGAGTTGARPTTVLLPTGERLTVRWFGDRPRVGRAAGDTTRLTVLTAGDRVYAVPAEAMPYLDRTLDRGLFDVAALAAAERPAGAASSATTDPVRVPLTVTGSAAVPGLHATGPSTGWLDPTGAAAFGAALRDRIRQDPAGARTGSPVPGLTRLALPGAPAATVRPNYPMETLSITLTPPTGQTVLAAAVMVTNTDDTRKFWSFTVIDGNLAKVSVPQGHYTLIGDVLTAAPDGSPGTNYLPITTDLAVTTTNQSTNLDANQATAESTYTTPATTALNTVNLDIAATDGVNDTYELGIFYGIEDQVLVQPTPEPAYGTLEFDTTEHRTDTTGADWDLTAEWSTGIPTDLHRTIKRSQLATVTDRVFADGATGTVGYSRGPVYPDLRGVEIGDAPTSATTHTNYLYGPPDVRWVASVGRNVDAAGTGDEGMFGVPVAYPPGRSYRADWFRESLAPGFESTVTFPRPYCVACRTGDQLTLILPSQLDGVAGHSGYLEGEATGWSRLRVLQDGTPVADAADTDTVTIPVPADQHSYRIESTVDRSVLGLTSATHSTAVYTVDSSATSGAPLPDGWYCQAPGTGACTVLPLLTVTAPLPTHQDGTLPSGTSSFVVTVGHLPSATTSAITALGVDTAIGTAAWTHAGVHPLGDGRYRVTLTLPTTSTGQPVAFRLHTEDAAGSTLTQTVTAAATIA